MRHLSLPLAFVVLLSASTGLLVSGQAPARAQTPPAPQPIRQPTVYDRQGRITGTVGEPGIYAQPAFPLDGSRVAANRAGDVWVFDIIKGTSVQITSTPDPEGSPLWSRDGSQIAYRRTGRPRVLSTERLQVAPAAKNRSGSFQVR